MDAEQLTEWARRYRWRSKLRVIEMLGGACANCGQINPLVLSVNHLEGRNGDYKGAILYRKIETGERSTADLDLRCLNCQRLYEYTRGALRLPNSVEFARLREVGGVS